jgi:hypothetical protein
LSRDPWKTVVDADRATTYSKYLDVLTLFTRRTSGPLLNRLDDDTNTPSSTGNTLQPQTHRISSSSPLLPTTPSVSSLFPLYSSHSLADREEPPHPHTELETETETEASPTTSPTFDFKTPEQERDHWKEKYDEVRDLFEDAKMEVGESLSKTLFSLGLEKAGGKKDRRKGTGEDHGVVVIVLLIASLLLFSLLVGSVDYPASILFSAIILSYRSLPITYLGPLP